MITGRQARELLDGTTPGPWHVQRERNYHPDDSEWSIEAYPSDVDYSVAVVDFDGVAQGEHDADLIASAPELAATVAWMYGRQVDDLRKVAHVTPAGAVAASPGAVVSDMGTFTPDETVDIARALLAAAEKARHE